MKILSLSQGGKILLLAILLGVLAVESAPLIPADRIPRSCFLTGMKGKLERLAIGEEKTVLRFKQPTQQAIAEWRNSGVSDEMIAANLISLPDYACDPTSGEVIKSIPEILGWSASNLPREYRASSLREAWTYTTYNPKTKSNQTHFELKPLPIIRKTPLYRKYESTGDQAPIGYLRVPPRLGSDLLQIEVGKSSIDESTAIFWEEVIRSSRPIILTEGAKKAASLLSNGYIAISIPGACRGIEVSSFTKTGAVSLRDGLYPLFRVPRKVFIAFDNDTRPKIRNLVMSATIATGKVLAELGSEVRVITIEGKEKGIDDFIVARGKTALELLITESKPFDEWSRQLPETIDIPGLMASPICGGPMS
jgi:hypothetical protein